jgi:CelD/BcsL family acetyltransferase involved in cellulose biosynthesis
MSSTALFRSDAEMARKRIKREGPILVATSAGTVGLRITDDLQSVEAAWRQLQARSPCTSAQTFDWARAWVRHVLGPEGREAVIVLGSAPGGEVLFIWPFEMTATAGLKVLHWLGHEHSNYNMGLFAPGGGNFNQDDLSSLLRAVGGETGAAAAILTSQPFDWDGIANPFAQLPHQPAPNSGYEVTLGDFASLYETRFSKRSRSILARKEAKLAKLGSLRYAWAETPDEKLGVLETFFAQKAEQFRAMGVGNTFDAHARAFYREIALLEHDNPARLRIGSIALGDKVLATFSGTVCHRRMILLLASLAQGETQTRPAPCSSSTRSNRPAPKGCAAWISAPAGARIRSNGPIGSSPCSTVSSP